MYVLQAKLRSQQLTYTLEAILSTQFIFSKKKKVRSLRGCSPSKKLYCSRDTDETPRKNP